MWRVGQGILAFYALRAKAFVQPGNKSAVKESIAKPEKKGDLQQCKHCRRIYDEVVGEPDNGIAAETVFKKLPPGYSCSLCEASVEDFVKIEKSELGLQPV